MAASPSPIASVFRMALSLALYPVTRHVVAAYPDSVIDFRGLTLQMGEHPTLVVRYLVTHADGSVSIVRLEDAVWVVTDDGQPARIGEDLAPLAVTPACLAVSA
jgi:hypothetical protein